MADTLEEIYNDSVIPVDLVGGEVTLFTTDANTRYAIKDVYVTQGETDEALHIQGDLEVNGFVVASVDTNATGTEIVGVSSTVKVVSDFALTYTDDVLQFQPANGSVVSLTYPTVNGVYGRSATITATSSPLGAQVNSDNTLRQVWTNIGASNRTVVYLSNMNDGTTFNVYESNGTQVFASTTSYRPFWFDGVRYAYYLNISNQFTQYDTWNNTSTTSAVVPGNGGVAGSTYGRIIGVRDDLIIGWSEYNGAVGNTKPIYWYLPTNTVGLVSTLVPNNTFSVLVTSGYAHSLVKRSNGTYRILAPTSTSVMSYVDYTLGTTFSAAQTVNTLSLTTFLVQTDASYAAVGSRVYYRGSSTSTLYYVDFDADTPTQGTLASPSTLTNYNGPDLWGAQRTPTAGEIAARTYSIAPSLNLRITGVKSV